MNTSHRIHPWAYVAHNQDVENLLLRIDLHPEHIDRGTQQASQMVEIINYIQDLKEQHKQEIEYLQSVTTIEP